MFPRETIDAFDEYLSSRGLSLEAVIVGGAALGLLGLTHRQTRDVDVLHPQLPEGVAEAAADFAREEGMRGHALAEDWLNNGPVRLKEVLPSGWKDRLQPAFQGKALVLSALGRSDLLKDKLFALCDRGTDFPDCIALAPTEAEISEAQRWVEVQDGNPLWPDHVRKTLDDLRRRLGHGV